MLRHTNCHLCYNSHSTTLPELTSPSRHYSLTLADKSLKTPLCFHAQERPGLSHPGPFGTSTDGRADTFAGNMDRISSHSEDPSQTRSTHLKTGDNSTPDTIIVFLTCLVRDDPGHGQNGLKPYFCPLCDVQLPLILLVGRVIDLDQPAGQSGPP